MTRIAVLFDSILCQSTHVSELWVAHLRLWDQLRWVVTVNSRLLSDNLGLKHFNFKFVILRSPRQECSRTRSAVLLPDHCHSTEFPTRQETHRVNISRI